MSKPLPSSPNRNPYRRAISPAAFRGTRSILCRRSRRHRTARSASRKRDQQSCVTIISRPAEFDEMACLSSGPPSSEARGFESYLMRIQLCLFAGRGHAFLHGARQLPRPQPRPRDCRLRPFPRPHPADLTPPAPWCSTAPIHSQKEPHQPKQTGASNEPIRGPKVAPRIVRFHGHEVQPARVQPGFGHWFFKMLVAGLLTLHPIQ